MELDLFDAWAAHHNFAVSIEGLGSVFRKRPHGDPPRKALNKQCLVVAHAAVSLCVGYERAAAFSRAHLLVFALALVVLSVAPLVRCHRFLLLAVGLLL